MHSDFVKIGDSFVVRNQVVWVQVQLRWAPDKYRVIVRCVDGSTLTLVQRFEGRNEAMAAANHLMAQLGSRG